MAFTMNFTIPSAIHLHATTTRERSAAPTEDRGGQADGWECGNAVLATADELRRAACPTPLPMPKTCKSQAANTPPCAVRLRSEHAFHIPHRPPARRQSSVGAVLRSRPLYTFFRKKHGKGVDKTNLECYRKSIDVSTPLKRVLTKPEGKELEEWNWMREKGKY